MGLFPFTFASAAVRPATIDRVKALMWGLVWFIFATIFIWYFRTVPTSTVTVDVSGYVPLSTVLLLHAAVWVVSGAVVYALAAVVGESVGLVETLSRVLRYICCSRRWLGADFACRSRCWCTDRRRL
jgi:hypothetical protein